MEENKNSYSGIKGFFLGVLVTLAVGSAVFLVKNWDYVVHKEMKPTELGAKTKVSDIYERIQDAYLGEIDDEKLTDYMCTGLVAGLEDKYSTYYTQEQYEKMIESANGHYSGIGISILADESGKVVIESCGENTPAAEAGITAGDILLEIDGTRVTGMTASEAAKLIQNKKEGEAFSMTLNREGKDYTVEIAVREVEAISVAGSMLDEQVGYIRISEFTGVTSQQFADSYQKLKDQNMTKLIIDLRSNPGGLVSGVCDTLRQILPKGLIVYTEDKYGSRKEQTCDGETPIDIPMVVLVNGSSASASEIFAGAVQDYGVGTIVGTVTYGKGVVQDTYPLDNGGAVKLTVSHYFTPKGNDINGKGITPDVVCELPDDASEDLQIEKAKEILGR
jgi:carboxyl-terminal processing protease